MVFFQYVEEVFIDKPTHTLSGRVQGFVEFEA